MSQMNPFGKPPAPANLPSYGDDFENNELDRSVQSQRKNGGGGGGDRRQWVETTKVDANTWHLLFHRAQFVNKILRDGKVAEVKANNFRFVEHWNNRAAVGAPRQTICSAVPFDTDWKESVKLCTGCMAHQEGWRDNGSGKRVHDDAVRKSANRAFSVLHLEHYTEVPGATNPKTGQPYMNAKGRNVLTASDWARYGAKATFGRRLILTMSENSHYAQFVGGNDRVPFDKSIVHDVQQCCGNCGMSASIRRKGWKCSDCEAPFAGADATAAEIKQAAQRGGCRVCQGPNIIEDITGDNRQCSRPARASIYTSVVTLRGIPAAKGTTLTLVSARPFRREDYPQLTDDLLQPLAVDQILVPADAARQQKCYGRLAPTLHVEGLEIGGSSYDNQADDNIPF